MPDGPKSAEREAEGRAKGAEAALKTIHEHATWNALAATHGPTDIVTGAMLRLDPRGAAEPRETITVVGEDPDYEEIDGSKVVLQFEIPYVGWEMDNTGWITEDGRAWETSHGGGPIEMTPEELAALDERVDGWARGVHAAREAAQLRRAAEEADD